MIRVANAYVGALEALGVCRSACGFLARRSETTNNTSGQRSVRIRAREKNVDVASSR